jgi:hypothetical protein
MKSGVGIVLGLSGLLVLACGPAAAQEASPVSGANAARPGAAMPREAPGKQSPVTHPKHRRHRHRASLRVPDLNNVPALRPSPAQQAAAGTTPAPVPNEDIGPPQRPLDAGGEVTPGGMSIHYPPLGDGYLPGSSSTDMDNRTTPAVPGLKYEEPIQNPPPQPLPPPDAGH